MAAAVGAAMISADVSCTIAEVDFAGIEAVLTGWCFHQHGISSDHARDYIRLARCGMHGAVTACYLGVPADLSLDDAKLMAYLTPFKEETIYRSVKATVHASAYGMSLHGMLEQFPELYRDEAEARKIQQFYHQVAPALPQWHNAVRKQAREVGYLGGPTLPGAAPSRWDHPYGYRHWFWDVLSYKPADEVTARKWMASAGWKDRIVQIHGRWFKIVWGGDSKRTLAFYPQSIAAGVLKAAEMALFADPESPDFIGDAYFGRTPLLGVIHDSILLHIPLCCADRIIEIVTRVMQAPIAELPIPDVWGWGSHLRIGVDAKAGRDWSKSAMRKIAVPRLEFSHAGADSAMLPREEADREDWDALARRIA